MLTGYDHVAVNFNRQRIIVEAAFDRSNVDGFRDHLAESIDQRSLQSVAVFLTENEYDSEAICDDLLAMCIQSNIGCLLGGGGECTAVFRRLTQMMLKYKRLECELGHLLEPSQCPHIDAIVTNLLKFRECGLCVEASNPRLGLSRRGPQVTFPLQWIRHPPIHHEQSADRTRNAKARMRARHGDANAKGCSLNQHGRHSVRGGRRQSVQPPLLCSALKQFRKVRVSILIARAWSG